MGRGEPVPHRRARGAARSWGRASAGRGLTAILAGLAAAVACGAASAAPGLLVGANDDSLKATPAETSAVAGDLGLRAYALSLRWSPGETALSASAAGALGTATRAAGGNRVVLAIYGDTAPASPEWREDFCRYARDALARFPQVNDIVIWNEPNLSYFWAPQYDLGGVSWAPSQYGLLLERCYDLLHAFRPSVNVIAPATSPWGNDDPFAQSNIGHSPTSFILQLGRAFDAVWLGPEIQAMGGPTYRQFRLGLHMTAFKIGDYEWSAGLGFATDSDRRDGVYARLSVLTRR